MKTKLSLGLLVCVVVSIMSTGFARRSAHPQSATVAINVKDLPDRGLSIVSPSDPTYMQLVSELLQGKSDPLVQTLAPYSIFVKNNSDHAVVACILKWQMVTSSGKTLLWKMDYTNFQPLMGKDISEVKEGFTIRPGRNWFFTPSYLNFEQEPIESRPEALEDLNRILTQLQKFVSISVSLDGVFFEDGSFVGPDTTEFFAQTQAKRDGRRDAFLEIVNEKKSGKTDAEIFKSVEKMSNEKINARATTPADFYKTFKKNAADEILKAKAVEGEARSLARAESRLKKPWPELKKL